MAFLYPRQSREWKALFVGTGEPGRRAHFAHDSQESGRLSLSDLASQADEPTLPMNNNLFVGTGESGRTSLLCPRTTVWMVSIGLMVERAGGCLL